MSAASRQESLSPRPRWSCRCAAPPPPAIRVLGGAAVVTEHVGICCKDQGNSGLGSSGRWEGRRGKQHLKAGEGLHQELLFLGVLREEADVGAHVDAAHRDLEDGAALSVLAAVGECRRLVRCRRYETKLDCPTVARFAFARFARGSRFRLQPSSLNRGVTNMEIDPIFAIDARTY